MRRSLLAATLLLITNLAFADIASDLADGIPMETLIANALLEDSTLTLADIATQVALADSSKVAAFVETAVAIDPNAAVAVVQAAATNAPSQATQITEAAVKAGADSTTVVNTVATVSSTPVSQLNVAATNGLTARDTTAAGTPNVTTSPTQPGTVLLTTSGGGTVPLVLVQSNTNLGGLETTGSAG